MEAVRHNFARRAFMTADMLFGIFIVTSVTVILATIIHREQVAEGTLADTRRAVHLAEHALLNLQHHQPLPVAPAGTQLTVHRTSTGTAPAGLVWVQVSAIINGRHQSLLGVVPVTSLESGEVK